MTDISTTYAEAIFRVKSLQCQESPVAQWLVHPTRSRRVVGSNPISGSEFSESPFLLEFFFHLTLKMASAQVVETSVTNNSPSQDSYHPDDLFQSIYEKLLFVQFLNFALYVFETILHLKGFSSRDH